MSGSDIAGVLRMRRIWLLLLLPLLLALAALPVAAQDGEVTDDEVNAIARDLYCPVCENTPLDACPTQACQDWRDEIRTQLRQGRSEAEIQQYFVDRYGAQVLSAPPREGFNWLIWILPVVAVAGGALVFGLYLRSIRTSPSSGDSPDDTFDVAQGGAQKPPPAPAEDDYISRVEKEVREE
ncbi:MAG TPA: cytochrome c-type biogenesis protein [Candidatus Sulfomarinibacteraceae bacterium]|nr:cytochrome c-type biogenesis protein [Candidatus Sulfomarinibacteraceae bacterium]